MTTDPHNDWGITGNNWPPTATEADLRARLDAMEALVLDRETNGGGLIEACRARLALGMGPRPRHKENNK